MRLHDLDRAAWAQIADELSALADQIAFDPHPDIPIEDYPDAPPGEWPEDSLAVEVWRDLTRAATLALCASVAPRATLRDLGAAFANRRTRSVPQPVPWGGDPSGDPR